MATSPCSVNLMHSTCFDIFRISSSVLSFLSFLLSHLFSGGVLEKNEIFNNRFDGVSLATGVLPKMIGKLVSTILSL